VIITFRRSNENSPGLQKMLKILLPKPNALSATADDVVDSLAFFLFRKLLNSRADVVSDLFQSVILQEDNDPSKLEISISFRSQL